MTTVGERTLAVEDWDSLVYSVKRGQCVLMLGPDAVTTQVAGRRVPTLDALGAFLQRQLQRENPYVVADFDQASAVAQAVLTAARGQRDTLLDWVSMFHESHPVDEPVLEQVAALPFGLILNTAPGVAVEAAFGDLETDRRVDYYNRHGRKADLVPEWSEDTPLIYHLYGSLEKPSSLVVSDDDHLDFLLAVIRDQPPLPANLTSAFQDPETTFLFLGFQLHQWQLRVLMYVLDKASQRSSRSFALEVPAVDVDASTRNFYSSAHGIDFFDMSVADFVGELCSRVDSDHGVKVAASPVAPDSPAVFLCHASEDKPFVDDLAQRLRAAGLNTWLDKDDIRGGADWDDLIERTLTRDVGYVVVVQSPNLAAKRQQRSYVNKEIRIALDVQREFPPGRHFLIPVLVDRDADRDAELDHLQSIDVSTTDGFRSLVSDLKRDIERGRKK